MPFPSELSRRNWLQVLAGSGLSFLLPSLSAHAANERGGDRMKSLIVLWMAGGPSQLETWDPHPNSKIGGPTRAIETNVKGLQIAADFPRLAEQIGHLNVIRSLVSQEGDHERGTYFLKTGYRPDPTAVHPALGAMLQYKLPDDSIEIPQHVSLGGGQWPARGGFLGDEYDAFRVGDPGRSLPNLRPRVAEDRQSRRLKNLDVLQDSFRRRRPFAAERSLHATTTANALRMMRSEQLKAFEIDDESAEIKTAYGDSTFGRGCLVARRLVEQGVRAVEVTLSGFDTHANNFDGHREQAEILDPAFATLIADLKQRDLLDSTVVLCVGEFGRTPRVNPLDGRDHWPGGFSCVLGGGGLNSGVVIGETDPTGHKRKPTDPVAVEELFATVLKTVGLDHTEQLITQVGRPIQLSSGTPLAALFPTTA